MLLVHCLFYFSKSFLTQFSASKHCNLCKLFFHQITTTHMYSIESKIFDYMGFVIARFDIQWSWTFWILRVLSYSLLADYLVLLFQYINCVTFEIANKIGQCYIKHWTFKTFSHWTFSQSKMLIKNSIFSKKSKSKEKDIKFLHLMLGGGV